MQKPGLISLAMILWLASGCATAPVGAPHERVAVLITQWGEPEGFDETYRRRVTERTYGDLSTSVNDPCTANHVGTIPFASHLGMLPFALAYPVKGVEGAYDSFGFYRLSADGQTYVSVFDPKITYRKSELPQTPGLVIPAIESQSRTQRSLWGLDPRDGRNYLDGIWQIGAGSRKSPNPLAWPNGIRDLDEISYVAGITDMNVLYEDQRPRLSEANQVLDREARRVLSDLFGDAVDVRSGAYAPSDAGLPPEEDVAVAFAREGFTKIVIARETTDNNNYANNFMSRGYSMEAVCRAGFDGKMAVEQVRQIGRTPEYNWALMQTLKPHLERVPDGGEVTILYATYGLPWPGGNPQGPFAQPHPWAKEVYHENAYNNYIAFKRYAEMTYGSRWRLNFNHAGKTGDRRPDSYFGYGMYKPELLQDYGLFKEAQGQDLARENRFRTLREEVDLAKSEGRRELIILPSHWYDNGRDPLLALRLLQEFPLNTREDFRKGKFWVEWCEKPGSTQPVGCDSADAGLTRIQFGEAFDKVAREVTLGYAHRIRGGIERFGVFPGNLDVRIAARGAVRRDTGGTVEVTSGALAGARLQVAADAHPGWPESFDWKQNQMFVDPADNFISAWDDFTAYIGTQKVPLGALERRARVVSEPALIGPYRTLVNRPMTVTLPFRNGKVETGAQPYIYNEVTRDWDPVYRPAGSPAVRFDEESGTASFDSQVFGVFALAVAKN